MISQNNISHMPVQVEVDHAVLHGDLQLPADPVGVVIFVHGSGSSRFSPRNKYVAGELNRHGLATLLIDLLTDEEHRKDEVTLEFRFDIRLLGIRSTAVARWVEQQPETAHLPIGLFGASTGAAAALITAAVMKGHIAAVVSRGGRPDLATEALSAVQSPTLLIVGGNDELVLELNRNARKSLHCESKLQVIPGATHLFEEPGTLEEVASAAAQWFLNHMRQSMPRGQRKVSGWRIRM